jgi:DNA recombination protein RmuC
LPQLETIERDYETEPLTMIVEAIEEEDEAHLLPHSEQQTSANE